MLTSAAPTILSVETDSAWVVILGVSLVTFFAALVLRRLITRTAGLASGIFLSLPLVLPLLAAVVYEHEVLPEIAVLQPAGRALRERSSELLHLLLLSDSASGTVVPYALSGSAGSWLVTFGIAVSSFMLLRRVVGAVVVHRLVRRCTPVEPWVLRGAVPRVDRLAEEAGLKRLPEVLLLPAGTPGAFAVGARRGRILLSPRLLTELDADELEGILAHEMAHIEARDCQVMFIAGLLRDVVAWNPIAHLSYRKLTMDRELEADRRAAVITGKPLAVASSLLKVCELVRGSKLRHRAAVAFLRPGARISRRVGNLLAVADGGGEVVRPGQMQYVVATVLLAVMGLQVGARIASQDSRAFAIMWGSPTASPSDTYDFRSFYRDSKQPVAKARKGREDVRPRTYARFANGRSAVRTKDVKKWYRAMNAWALRQAGPHVRLRWESRQDWMAQPLFSEVTFPFEIYSIERQPL
ncbi:MAG: M56 family metallopeptidase [Actinomycetota bacterium]